MRHLMLNLEAPLMAFGGETIDNQGVSRWFPSTSMITGLLANALGWRRTEYHRHQDLQDRLEFAARIDREPPHGLFLRDFQTAQLAKNDRGWTTRKVPEGREGGTYGTPHLRHRHYLADARVTAAVRLRNEREAPDIDDIAAALDEPARPLFIGRKPCLPSGRILVGIREAQSVLAALLAHPMIPTSTDNQHVRLLWPAKDPETSVQATREYMLSDQRNWISGLHGGGRMVREGRIPIAHLHRPPDGEQQ